MIIKMADLFCGAGGMTAGAESACNDLGFTMTGLAVNHWQPAMVTHSINNPNIRHICDKLNKVNPKTVAPDPLDILIAAPECTHHSNARGGKPIKDQKRSPAWLVVKWIKENNPKTVLIENVKEFQTWGPIDENGQRIKSRSGEFFKSFIRKIRNLGYSVDFKVLCCADYGDPTTRRRLFIMARRDGKPIAWPEKTHGDERENQWVPAGDIIDWNIKSKSIFERKKPLVENTLKRIEAGIRKFWGPWAEPFLVVLRGTSESHLNSSQYTVDKPLPGLCASGTHIGLVEPLILPQQQGFDKLNVRSTKDPISTITTKGAEALVQPFLTILRGQSNVRDIYSPTPTISCGEHFGLAEPFFVQYHGGPDGEQRTYPLDKPIPTLDTQNRYGLIEPFLVEQSFRGAGDNLVRSVDRPAPTLLTKQHICMCEPFIVEYYSNNGKPTPGHNINKPLPTLTCRDRFGVIQQFGMDIHYRMLQPHELAAAMSFPKNYSFYGNREKVVKQIGNAVPVETARALVRCLLEQTIVNNKKVNYMVGE